MSVVPVPELLDTYTIRTPLSNKVFDVPPGCKLVEGTYKRGQATGGDSLVVHLTNDHFMPFRFEDDGLPMDVGRGRFLMHVDTGMACPIVQLPPLKPRDDINHNVPWSRMFPRRRDIGRHTMHLARSNEPVTRLVGFDVTRRDA